MQMFSTLFLIGFAASALAVPFSAKRGWPPGGQCLTTAEAQDVVNTFISVTSGKGTYNATVCHALLASDFSDTSSSIASIVDNGTYAWTVHGSYSLYTTVSLLTCLFLCLTGGTAPIPLGGPTFSSADAFCNANANQPATVYNQLNLYHTCTDVIFRFAVTNLSPETPMGISILETVVAPAGNLYPYQISQVNLSDRLAGE